MRTVDAWRNKLIPQLKKQWPDSLSSLSPSELCDVELGLYLVSNLAPNASAKSVWTLLFGYPFPAPEAEIWTEHHHRMLGNARHLLPYYRSHYPWERALTRYRSINSSIRGYEVEGNLEQFKQLEVSICSKRWQVYEEVLSQTLAYKQRALDWATFGTYTFPSKERQVSVQVHSGYVFPPPEGHRLAKEKKAKPLIITWEQLLDTARWMDARSPASWEKRLSHVQLELFENDKLVPMKSLTLDGLVNLIGMVSSGKSTLMDVLAVWCAKNGLHITLVVSDVINAMNRAQLFDSLNIRVAPILGSSNREKHTNRLHAAIRAQTMIPLAYEHVGFRWLSTSCPLDGLHETDSPLRLGEQPCLSLKNAEGKTHACPLYSKCPFHQAQRDLVTASVWIATAASLVYTHVAPQINKESLRFAELVYRRSDLVIIDEADQVQTQLDLMFSPSQTLVSRGTDWLGQLWQSIVPQLDRAGRGQLVNQNVDRWCQAHEIVQTTANRIYSLILQENLLRKWIERDYFTDWTLFDRLATEFSEASVTSRFDDQGYIALMQTFRAYMEDPLGENVDQALSTLAEKAVLLNNEQVRPRLEVWVKEHVNSNITPTASQLSQWVVQLHFSLLLAVLQNRLNFLIRDWKQVEQPLNLEGASSAMFYSPPEDYNAVVPASPMGNVLAFQYLKSYDDPSAPGDLRFFRCAGVGRWILIHLHDLFKADGLVGPHVLLLSGTSWAGTSPSYHIQVPVTGILRAPKAEVQAIEDASIFRLLTFVDEQGQPITVSGRRGNSRLTALKEILNKLASIGGLGGSSRLEREQQQLPTNRKKIMLLVGSYDEANEARLYLESIRPDWKGKVISLIPDDNVRSYEWESDNHALQRGQVAQFANLDAWLLIAPLLAIERGHNILNEAGQAAVGAAYFLVRPHPHPTDLGFALQSINSWAITQHANKDWLTSQIAAEELNLTTIGRAFRNAAYRRWRYLLALPLIYSTLPNKEREAITWNALVTIWQVIGRLIRGGSPARIYFCDAAFARYSAAKGEQLDTPATSLLVGIKTILAPYFESGEDKAGILPSKDKALVQALYGPFYKALKQIRGVTDAQI